MSNELPIVCDGCGACCLEIGTPPFLGFEIYNLPEPLRNEVLTNNTIDREESKLPCYWFDIKTRKCKHYEYRPQLCRDFEVGCISCLKYREILSKSS